MRSRIITLNTFVDVCKELLQAISDDATSLSWVIRYNKSWFCGYYLRQNNNLPNERIQPHQDKIRRVIRRVIGEYVRLFFTVMFYGDCVKM